MKNGGPFLKIGFVMAYFLPVWEEFWKAVTLIVMTVRFGDRNYLEDPLVIF